MKAHYSDFSYIEEIYSSIYKNIIVASVKGNEDSFNELLDFLFYKLISGSFGFSVISFQRSVALIISIYQNIEDKHKDQLVERAVESLTTKINLANRYSDNQNEYISISYSTFINLLKIILEEDNHELFNKAFQKNDELLFKIGYRQNKNDYFFKFSTLLLCWIYFLKLQNKISFEKYRIDFLENEFLQLVTETENNFIGSFFKLYDETEKGLWFVNSWEIIKPPINKAYFSLMPNQWLPSGLAIILLRHTHLTSFIDYSKIDINRRFRYQLDDMKKILDPITIENTDIINLIFPNKINSKEIQEQLNYRKEKIIEIFSVLKRTAEIAHYKKIQLIPLSDQKIEEFRQNVGTQWQSNTVIINLLKQFNQVNYLDNIETRDGFGFFHTLQKGKFAFIEGEHYQEIYGLSNFGSELARNLDNQFFDLIYEKGAIKEVSDIKSYIKNYLARKKNIEKTVIFANWRVNEVLGVNYNHGKNLRSSANFCNVPILNSYSKRQDYIYIIDFTNVNVDIYTSNSEKWFNKELLVDVTEYKKGEIGNDEIKRWNEKDGLNYSSGDVDVLESNNVDIKVLFKGEYRLSPTFKCVIIKL